MRLTTVLFDLDGTLLPMDQDVFVKTYFGFLAKKMAPYGYEPKALIDGIWAGTAAMVKNTGGKTNEAAFWDKFTSLFGEKALEDVPKFEDFYRNEFQAAQASCGYDPAAAQTVRKIKGMGLRVALATNPIFPRVATESRTRWAGLEPEDFELYTTYENTCCCKPNLDYYRDVLRRLGVQAGECLMVGNDVSEDMIAQDLGMRVFLMTHSLINKEKKDISAYPNGDFHALLTYIEAVCQEL